jgi:hypothetical protein
MKTQLVGKVGNLYVDQKKFFFIIFMFRHG